MSEVGVTFKATTLAIARSKQSRLHNYNVLAHNRHPMKCTKYGLDNHIIKGCYEIIGYPEGWIHKKHKRDSNRASFASAWFSYKTILETPSGNHKIKGSYEIIGYLEGWIYKKHKRDSNRASFESV
jgi:tRNA G10  N-methylase Trm11